MELPIKNPLLALTPEMIKNHQLFDDNGEMLTYKTPREYSAAILKIHSQIPEFTEEMMDEMAENRQTYDSNGVLKTYETDEEFEAAQDEFDAKLGALAEALTEFNASCSDDTADLLDRVRETNDMTANIVSRHDLDYERSRDADSGYGSDITPEERAKDSIRRFLQTLSPTFPRENDGPLIPKRGELIHVHFPAAVLYESISSSNTDLRYVGAGDLYVTNKRFAFVFNSQVRSLPYREIEVFTSGWIPGAGRIRISSSTRARMMEFEVPNVFKVSFYFTYYTNPSFEEQFKAAGNLRFDTEKRRQLIDAYYARAEEGLRQKAAEEAARKAAAMQAPVSAGPGCGVWLFLLVAIGLILILVVTNSGR